MLDMRCTYIVTSLVLTFPTNVRKGTRNNNDNHNILSENTLVYKIFSEKILTK